jgi:uncharacterized protein YndB with AHSA1/START domain
VEDRIERTVVIRAQPSVVWEALTIPEQMFQWMSGPELHLRIATTWEVGSPMRIWSKAHVPFENDGQVLQFEPERLLAYNHLSSLSRLPKRPENYSTLVFRLAPASEGTALTVSICGFPTETIFQHLNFYWRVTLGILKRYVEERIPGLIPGALPVPAPRESPSGQA